MKDDDNRNSGADKIKSDAVSLRMDPEKRDVVFVLIVEIMGEVRGCYCYLSSKPKSTKNLPIRQYL